MIFSKEASERKHRYRILIAWIVSMAFVGAFAAYGFDYYTLAWKDRPFSPKHMLLRPSGPIGVNLGVFGVLMFFLIYLYPLRKRWGWLGRQGNSRHWLDFHVILGTAAPLVIALHSSFKFGGIAGMAFWIMTAVTASGFIGRYLYSQIPRTLNAAELTIKEIQDVEVQLRWKAEDKHEKIGTRLIELFALPTPAEVARTPMMAALCWMIWLDLKRPFQVSWLRLRAGGFVAWLFRFSEFSRRAIRNWKMPFKPRGGRRPCPSEFYSCPEPNRFLTCGTSFIVRLVIPLLSSPSFTLS